MGGKRARSGRKRIPVELHLLRGSYRVDRHGPLPDPNAKSTLSPSMRHYLQCGAASRSHLAPARLRGWLTTLQLTDTELQAIWEEHETELRAEAMKAGFLPVAAGWFNGDEDVDDVPADPDPNRERWSAAFCRQHGY